MMIESNKDENMTIEKSKWLLGNAALTLRAFDEEHPLHTEMVFRFCSLEKFRPPYMYRLASDGWLTLKYFTTHPGDQLTTEVSDEEYASFDFSAIPEKLFDAPRKPAIETSYAKLRLPIPNHRKYIDEFHTLEKEFKEPSSKKRHGILEHSCYFLEMGASQKYLGIYQKQKYPAFTNFFDNFSGQHLWFLGVIFSELE